MTSPAIRLPNVRLMIMRTYRFLLALVNWLFYFAGLMSVIVLAWQSAPAAMVGWEPVATAWQDWIGASVSLHFVVASVPLMVELIFRVMKALHGDDLAPEQIETIRKLARAGWVVDWDGKTYELYGPTGQRESFADLADLEYIAEDRT